MQEIHEHPEYYTILPAKVRYDEKLSANAKILYSEIAILTKQQGYCHASNSYFAKLFNVSKVSVSKWVSELEKTGYLKREVIRDSDNKVINRKLYIEDLPINDIEGSIKDFFNRYQSNLNEGIKEKQGDPIKEKFKENNTSINNTSINNNITNKEKADSIPYKDIINYLNDKAGKSFRAVEGNKKYIRARWNEGYRTEDFESVIDNMASKWKGVTFKDGNNAERYLRPSTLFGNKFDTYLNENTTVPKEELGFIENAPVDPNEVTYSDDMMAEFNRLVEANEREPDKQQLKLLNNYRNKIGLPNWRID